MGQNTEQTTPTSPFLNVIEAASFLRLKRSTLDSYRWEGGGPKYRKHGNRVYYHVNELKRWSERREYRDSGHRT